MVAFAIDPIDLTDIVGAQIRHFDILVGFKKNSEVCHNATQTVRVVRLRNRELLNICWHASFEGMATKLTLLAELSAMWR